MEIILREEVKPKKNKSKVWMDKIKNTVGGVPQYVHGIVMWIAWTVCGLLQVISARYMGTSYEWRVKLHNLSGWLTVALAVFGFMLAYINADFKLTFNFHSIAGLVTIAQVPIVALVAMFASMARYGTYEWDT